MIGIYKITNKLNGNSYVGLSNDIKRRWSEHKAPKNIKIKNTILAKAFRKYGIENFKFEVLEECSIDELAEKEMYYIKILSPKYNMNEGGKGNLGHILSDEMKEHLSAKSKQIWNSKSTAEKEKIINNLTGPRKGHKVSKETREKLRRINLGKRMTEESKIKISEANKSKMIGNKNRNKKVCQIDKNTLEIIKVFDSVKESAKSINVDPSCITGVLKGRRKSSGGYYWRYLSECRD